jgi:6-phosphogluconolactonase
VTPDLDIRVHDTRDAAVEAVCELIWLAEPRSLVLTGGSTAGDAYRLLATPENRDRLDWGSVEILFGDERRVPPESRESNYHLAATTLLAGVRPGRVERMLGEAADPEAEADRYGGLIPDRLDVTLLGMGEDGHCASLFPDEPVLEERERLVVPSLGHYEPYARYTLTYPALERSRLVLFFVLGANKASALGAIARGEDRPSARVRPTDGQVVWIVDRAAAAELPSAVTR